MARINFRVGALKKVMIMDKHRLQKQNSSSEDVKRLELVEVSFFGSITQALFDSGMVSSDGREYIRPEWSMALRPECLEK